MTDDRDDTLPSSGVEPNTKPMDEICNPCDIATCRNVATHSVYWEKSNEFSDVCDECLPDALDAGARHQAWYDARPKGWG